MNHGKLNPPVAYCPDCGQRFQSNAGKPCNEEVHRERRKNRGVYCYDCGKSLKMP